MTWELASDIGSRLVDLRDHMGWTQPDLAKLVNRGYRQILAWEKGTAKVSKRVLEELATARGWPIEIFAEGGRLPSAVLPKPTTQPEAGTFDAELKTVRRILQTFADTGEALPAGIVQRWVDFLEQAHLQDLNHQRGRRADSGSTDADQMGQGG